MDFNYLNIDQVIKDPRFPFTKGIFRALLLNRKKNGLNVAVRKIGKRLYVRDDLLIQWMEEYGKET